MFVLTRNDSAESVAYRQFNKTRTTGMKISGRFLGQGVCAHRDMIDTAGRSYMRVSPEDAAYLDMKAPDNSNLYWVSLPRSATEDDQIDVGDRLREASTPNLFRVVNIHLPWMPRRRIAIVSLRRSV